MSILELGNIGEEVASCNSGISVLAVAVKLYLVQDFAATVEHN